MLDHKWGGQLREARLIIARSPADMVDHSTVIKEVSTAPELAFLGRVAAVPAFWVYVSRPGCGGRLSADPGIGSLRSPVVSAERESLVSCLDQQRESVLDIVAGLPEAALRHAVFPSGWTCLGLIHHLAVDNERYWFRGVAAGEPIEFPAGEDPGWVAGSAIAAGQVFRLYREEIARANAIIAATPLDAPARRRDPRWDAWGWPEPEQAVTLRWIILHMIEETARHAGHLDTAREILDGRTGLG